MSITINSNTAWAKENLNNSIKKNKFSTNLNTSNRASMADLINLSQNLRCDVVDMVLRAGGGHLGSSLGVADLMALMYTLVLVRQPPPALTPRHSSNFYPSKPTQLLDPLWHERDRFLLSAGHLAPVWYAVLARSGYFNRSELQKFRSFGSPLQGHPHRYPAWGIENSSGPLGQGISQSVGLSLGLQRLFEAGKLSRLPRVYVLSSDGEQQEGQVWEAYQSASHYGLDNLTLILDINNLQISGTTKEIMSSRDLGAKLSSFGWEVFTADGHNFVDLATQFRALKKVQGRPQALLINTVLGRGVSFMENNRKWHAGKLTPQLASQALAELKQIKY